MSSLSTRPAGAVGLRTRSLGAGALVFAGLVAACHGSELRGAAELTTTLDPDAVTAGTRLVLPGGEGAVSEATIGCTARGPGTRGVAASDFTVSWEPVSGPSSGSAPGSSGHPEGLRPVEGGLRAERAGTYVVRCEVPRLGLSDPDGALLTVSPGEPVATRPAFAENPVVARAATAVTCEVIDAFGNGIPLLIANFDVPPELTLADGALSGSRAGDFDVTCWLDPDDSAPLRRDPATLTVLPGPPVRLVLAAEPAREAYAPSAVVTLVWTAYDADENPIAGLPATLTAPTSPAASPVPGGAPNRYRLGGEGRYPFKVRLDPPAIPLSDEVTLVVDATPPTLTVTYPPRGATIAATAAPVTVRGVVTDAVGVRSLSINGEVATVAPDGTFAHPVASVWGLNSLTLEAVDHAANSARITPTYQYSDAWTSFIDEDARGLQQPDTIRLLLGQNFFDDGAAPGPGRVEDLADLVALALTDIIDVRGLVDGALAGVTLPDVPIANTQQRIDLVPNLSWVNLNLDGVLQTTLTTADTTGTGPVSVTIDSRDGGLDMTVIGGTPEDPAVAIDLVLTLSARFDVTSESCSPLGCIPGLPGVATLSAAINARIALDTLTVEVATDIAKSPGQPASVRVATLETRLDALRLLPIEDVVATLVIEGIPLLGTQRISFPLSSILDVGAIFDSLLTPLSTGVLNLLPQTLNPLIASIVGPLVEGVLSLLVLDTTVPLQPLTPGGTPVDLGLSTELSTIAFTDDGGTVALGTGLHTKRAIARDPLGAIVRGDCLGASEAVLDWGWDPSLSLGLSLDLGNSALFAAWWSGLLHGPIDLGALGGGGGGGAVGGLPLDGLSLTLDWLLPPIFNDCDPARGFVEIGDLAVTLSADALGAPISAELFADLRLSVTYETRPDGLYVVLGDVLASEFEVMALDDGPLAGVFDLRSLIVDALPGLLGGFLGGQALGPIALPPTDLTPLIPTLPAGTSLGLGPLRARTQAGYLIVGGDLE